MTASALTRLVRPLVWLEKPDGQDTRIGRCDCISYGVKFFVGAWGYTRHGEGGLTVSFRGGRVFENEAEAMQGAESDHTARIISALDPAALAAMLAEVRANALREGYRLGFESSAVGWNGEYPFDGEDLEADAGWLARRDRSLSSLIDKEPKT